MTPALCQVRFGRVDAEKGRPAHEAGREPVTLVERIEHYYALGPGDRPPGGEGALLQEALRVLREAVAQVEAEQKEPDRPAEPYESSCPHDAGTLLDVLRGS
jgi:hypothetical protein